MNSNEIKAVFEQQAANYEQQWLKIAPAHNGLYFMLESVFAALPADARVLCVGAGIGKELIHLAGTFPGWQFTVVEPAEAMLNICRQAAEEHGITARCYFHLGFLDSLATEQKYDAATCLLVSQFMLDKTRRAGFFRQIAGRLKADGILANADLSADSKDYNSLLAVWHNMMSAGAGSAEGLNRMKATYAEHVAILPPAELASVIASAGFSAPVKFFQAGLMHAWYARRSPTACLLSE